MNSRKALEEGELEYSAAKVLSGADYMERTRHAFDLFYRSSCGVDLNGPSILGRV